MIEMAIGGSAFLDGLIGLRAVGRNLKAARRLGIYWLVGVGLTLAYFSVRDAEWQGSNHLHTVMETAATMLAIMVGAMALTRYYSRRNNTFLFVGTAFLGTAFLDGYHAVVTSKFVAPYLPSDLHSLIPWSWVASRLFLSVLMFVCWVAWRREAALGAKGRVSEISVYLTVAGFTVLSFLFFAFVPLPRAYYPELVFHRPEELVPAAFFALALYGFLRKGKWRTDPFEHWLVLSLIVALVSQAVFMPFSGQVFDTEFDLAHLLKKASYICVLVGLLLNMHAIFRQVEDSVLVLNREVKVRKRAEARLKRRAEELARSNQELEEFASVASHDLQEPLRKIQAFGDRLKTKYADVLEDQGTDYVVRMQDAAVRMQALIQSLLTFSRVASKGQSFVPVDLNEAVEEVLSDLEVRIQETGAQVRVPDLPTIDADPSQMRQLFQNLIGNALKYRREGIAPVVEITAEFDGKSSGWAGTRERLCRVCVSDNGIGFENEYSDRIFGIFQRLHGRDEYEGTGVGLSIVRKIVERHGGSIAANGRPGEGASFVVTLPMTQSNNE